MEMDRFEEAGSAAEVLTPQFLFLLKSFSRLLFSNGLRLPLAYWISEYHLETPFTAKQAMAGVPTFSAQAVQRDLKMYAGFSLLERFTPGPAGPHTRHHHEFEYAVPEDGQNFWANMHGIAVSDSVSYMINNGYNLH